MRTGGVCNGDANLHHKILQSRSSVADRALGRPDTAPTHFAEGGPFAAPIAMARAMIHCANACSAAKKERSTAPPGNRVDLRRAVGSRCRFGARRQQQEVAVDDRLGDVDQLVAVVL